MGILTIKYKSKYQDFVCYPEGLDLCESAASLAAFFNWLPPLPKGLQMLSNDGNFWTVLADKRGFVKIPCEMQSRSMLEVQPFYGPWWRLWL